MKTSMYFSLLKFPLCRINTLANSWLESFHKLGSSGGSSSYRILSSTNHEPEGQHSRRWTRRTINSKAEGNSERLSSTAIELDGYKLETAKARKTKKIAFGDKVISRRAKAKLNTSEFELKQLESDLDYDELAKKATIICFDVETTGFKRDESRIIDIAFQDLQGGENSHFQTLVNPECYVPNKEIHGISTRMVNRHDVPRMKDLIPILLDYIKSRQIPGGIVVLVAHNGGCFDVPFLKNEFRRCDYEIPEDWVFVDTLKMCRAVMKSKGYSKASLQVLREHYGIPLMGSAHRALSDVQSLALVLQRLTQDLKLTKPELIRRWSFK